MSLIEKPWSWVRILRRLDIEMGYLSERIGLKSRPPIHLHIQSPGGDVFSGLNICDAIDSCKTSVYTYVEGSAASAATIIASRGKKKVHIKKIVHANTPAPDYLGWQARRIY